jgi:hypothetical protein
MVNDFKGYPCRCHLLSFQFAKSLISGLRRPRAPCDSVVSNFRVFLILKGELTDFRTTQSHEGAAAARWIPVLDFHDDDPAGSRGERSAHRFEADRDGGVVIHEFAVGKLWKILFQ